MAKIKTTEELEKLKAEAKKIIQEAKKREREILAKVKEEEREIFASIGESAVAFINKKIDKDELKKLVKAAGLFEEVEEIEMEKEEDMTQRDNENMNEFGTQNGGVNNGL